MYIYIYDMSIYVNFDQGKWCANCRKAFIETSTQKKVEGYRWGLTLIARNWQ
jgi:hypothetical protein